MKLREIFRYELAHRLRSPSTWVYAGLLLVLALMMGVGDGGPATAVDSNAPSRLAGIMLVLSLPSLAVTAALFGDASVRDFNAEMDPLLFTAPLRRLDYLGGRFLSAYAANAIVLLAFPIGFGLPVMLGLTHGGSVGPFQAAAYVQPYLFLLLPNVLLWGSVLFATGMLTRRTIPVYLAAIGLFVATMIALGPDADDNVHPLLSVFGPLGFHALNELTQYWSAAEQNARLIGLPINLLLNRIVWIGVAVLVLAGLHWRFRFAHPDGGRRRERRRAQAAEEPVRLEPVAVPRMPGRFGFGTTLRQTFAVARNALLENVANRWFVVVLLACVVLPLLWGSNVGDTVFDTPTWPVTALVAEMVLSQRAAPLFYLLTILFAGELVWKDRDVRVAEIADATPVAGAAAVLGRFLALVVMLALWSAASIIGGMLIQAFHGYFDFEPGLYLRIVFGLNFAVYALFAALALTVHVVVNHKYVGHIAAVTILVLTMSGPRIGITHHLLLYNTDPGWTYSYMNGFGPFVVPFVWFRLYWAAWALLLGVAATLLWVRGREYGLRDRLRVARVRFTAATLRTAAIALLLIVGLGGFIFYNTNVLNEYVSPDDQGETQADYEKRYGPFSGAPQPTIESAGLLVEIYPDEHAVDLRGSYRIVNRTDSPIDSVHVFVHPDVEARAVSFDRAARAVVTDDEVGFRIHELERPLQPGESMQLSFEVAYRRHGFSNDVPVTAVAANGAYFNRSWLPFVGYQPAFELSDEEARARFGLAPRPPLPGPEEAEARGTRYAFRGEDRVRVETIVGTSADQVAITPGELRREWTANGRRYFHYEMEQPQSFGATVFSGRYAVHEERWNDITLRVYHHPDHDDNLATFFGSMKASLEYYSQRFSPYQGSQLSIVQIPRYDRFGRAHPHTIAFTEDFFFTRPVEGRFDQLFFGTAHEIAHQWWGGQVRGAGGVRSGAGFLSESLANYSALMVTEQAFGGDAAQRVYDYQMNRYLSMRARVARDVPLLDVEDQAYIFYAKGAVSMFLLQDHIGAGRVDAALQRYLRKHGAGEPPYPTSRDLYAELRAVTPDSLQYLLTDLFETVTLWDLKTERATVTPVPEGGYEVTLDVVARKVRADPVGNETEVAMNDLVEVGVFGERPSDDSSAEPLYLKRHRIRSGAQTIRVRVPSAPERAGVDPRRMLIERERADNTADVDAAVHHRPQRDGHGESGGFHLLVHVPGSGNT